MPDIESLEVLQTELNTLRQRRRDDLAMYLARFGPLPPPSRRLRFRWWIRSHVRGLREGVARKIAPWLE